MKKYSILLGLLICSFVILSAQTYTVGYGGAYDYDNIQDAVDAASDGYSIHVYRYMAPPYQYEGFTYDGKDLDIYSQGFPLPVINGNLSSPSLSIIVDMTYIENQSSPTSYPQLRGFEIIGASNATGVKLTNLIDTGNGALIEKNIFDGLGTAIHVGNNPHSVTIKDNVFLNNVIAYYSKETGVNAGGGDSFQYNTVYNNDTGLYLAYRSNTYGYECLIYNNGISIDLTDDLGQTLQSIELDRCTIANTSPSNTDTGIYVDEYASLTINNCILYWNDTQIDDDGGTITVTYSDIEGGYAGTGNINSDPFFCKETNYEFHLLEGSPCIDTGDPTDEDDDDTRLDMGCYPSNIDIKYCEGDHWNWVSFPKLDRDDDDDDEATDFLELFTNWPFDLELEHTNGLVLDYTSSTNTWYPTSYPAYSSKGYKLNPEDSGEYYLLSQSAATRLDPEWQIEFLAGETRNWMGYWLPYTQNIVDAFGDFWENVFAVDAEDWYYEFSVYETPTSSTTNKNLVYGKGYIVTFYEDVEDFCWTDATDSRSYGSPGNPRPEPQYFIFNDLPDYEAIDVMDIPANVIEIGVFEDDVCIGAVVVQDDDAQILAYSTNANRSQVPLTFEVVTNNRGDNLIVSDYFVKNVETGRYENRSLISGQQKHSIVMFGNLEDPQNNSPSLDEVILKGNYPNPFNPETTISFSLSNKQNIELLIYNLKGQKVRQLLNGQFTSGDHSVTWDGKDNEGKNVGSGLYFYKLKTSDNEYSKKMLLLK